MPAKDVCLEEVVAYGNFLERDKGIPLHLGCRVGAFMLLARDVTFFEKPSIWAPRDKSLGVTMARVYFYPWSQNSLPAFSTRCMKWQIFDKMHFCAEQFDLVATSPIGTRSSLLALTRAQRQFSGARTRAAFEEAIGEFVCLRDRLASMF